MKNNITNQKKPLQAYKIISIVLSIISFIIFLACEIGKSILKEPISRFLGELVENYSPQELNAELARLYFNEPETLKTVSAFLKLNNICNKAIIPLILCIIFVSAVILISLYQKKRNTSKEIILEDTSQQVTSCLTKQTTSNKSHKGINRVYTVICMIIAIIYFIYCAISLVAVIALTAFSGLGDDFDFSQIIMCASLFLLFLIGGLVLLPFIKRIIDKHITNKTKKICLYIVRILFIPIIFLILKLITLFL